MSNFSRCNESVELEDVDPSETKKLDRCHIHDFRIRSPSPRRLCGFPVFGKDGHHRQSAEQYRLENNLLLGVGFLEFANCGDFAANVWNTVPVPTYALAFMIIGGLFALIMTNAAYRDAGLSWRNLRALRRERQRLKTQRQQIQPLQCRDVLAILDARLAVNLREIGTELVDRLGMDISLGFGVLLVGVGSLLATGGANRKIFKASNLLSGYIGNSPAALYGIINAAWSLFITRRASRHIDVAMKGWEDQAVQIALRSRNRNLQLHAGLSGITGLVSGAASMITATMWYGYLALIPCIVSSIFCNYLWRYRLGYRRPLVLQDLSPSYVAIRDELVLVRRSRQLLATGGLESLRKMGYNPQLLRSLMKFLTESGLIEDLCIDIITHSSPYLRVPGDSEDELTGEVWKFLVDSDLSPFALKLAQDFISERALACLVHRESFLLELLGCYLECLQ